MANARGALESLISTSITSMFMERIAATIFIADGGMTIPGAIIMARAAGTTIRAAFGSRFPSAIRTASVAGISTRAGIGCLTWGITMLMASVADIITTIASGGIILGCTTISMGADIIIIAAFGWISRQPIFTPRPADTCTMDCIGTPMAIRAMSMVRVADTTTTRAVGIRIRDVTTRVTVKAAFTFSWI